MIYETIYTESVQMRNSRRRTSLQLKPFVKQTPINTSHKAFFCIHLKIVYIVVYGDISSKSNFFTSSHWSNILCRFAGRQGHSTTNDNPIDLQSNRNWPQHRPGTSTSIIPTTLRFTQDTGWKVSMLVWDRIYVWGTNERVKSWKGRLYQIFWKAVLATR